MTRHTIRATYSYEDADYARERAADLRRDR